MLRLRVRPAFIWLWGNQEIEVHAKWLTVLWCDGLSLPVPSLSSSPLSFSSRIRFQPWCSVSEWMQEGQGWNRALLLQWIRWGQAQSNYIIITTTGSSLLYFMIHCVLPLLFSFILLGQHLQWGKTLNSLFLRIIQSRITGEKCAELQRGPREIEHAQVPSSGSCSRKKDCPLSCTSLFVYIQPSSWKSADRQSLAWPPKLNTPNDIFGIF